MNRSIYLKDYDGISHVVHDGNVLDTFETPTDWLTSTEQLYARVAARFTTTGGVLFLDQAHADRLNVTDGFSKVRQDGKPRINLCVPHLVPGFTDDRKAYPLVADFTADTTGSYALWHQLTGLPWHTRAAGAGTDLMEASIKVLEKDFTGQDGKVFPVRRKFTDGPEGATEAEYLKFQWSREEAGPRVGWDTNRARLSAAMLAKLYPWALKHTGEITFDKALSGWWLIDVPTWTDERLPDPAGYGEPRRWVTSPTMEILEQVYGQGAVTIHDSWTGKGKHLLRNWAKSLEDVYQAAGKTDDEHDGRRVRQGVKGAYRAGIGALNTQTGSNFLHRPDWQNTIVALERCNLWRKISKAATAGRYPLWIATDEVVYVGDTTTPPDGFKTGRDALGYSKSKEK